MHEKAAIGAKTYKVPAVEQAVRVLLGLANSGSTAKSLTDICQEVGIHRSKAFSILHTLGEYGFIKKNPNRRGYVLGPGLLTLTGKILETLSLSRLVEPTLYELAKKAGATVALGIISDDKTYVIAEYEGAPGIGISSPIGFVTPITYGSHGKAIAAALSDDEFEELLASGDLYFYGRPEKYSEAKLRREIKQCRRDGYAMELGDIQPGVNAIAAAVLDQKDSPIGYITIVGFFNKEVARKLGRLVVEAAKVISRETGHMLLWQKANNRRQPI